MRWTLGVLLVAACGFAQAADTKSGSSVCETLGTAFEGGIKNLSVASVSGLGDNSAARETNRELEKVIETNIMQMNLVLLQGNKCPLPKEPVIDNAYYLDALRCSNARMKNRAAETRVEPPECDTTKWTRMGSEKK